MVSSLFYFLSCIANCNTKLEYYGLHLTHINLIFNALPNNIFYSIKEHLEKAKVLQDARIFHDSILVRETPRKCCRILAQILYLQNDPRHPSSKLTQTEATELFFASTKLFVDAEDASLRRLVYLFIKEIQPLCDPSDVIIVTSCLTKDMTCDIGLYRSNAIRVLVSLLDNGVPIIFFCGNI